jgi:hypothetical protein
MTTNRDIKAMIEARKERRAIPQTDPTEVVAAMPEPELAGPPTVEPTPNPTPAQATKEKKAQSTPNLPTDSSASQDRLDARYLPVPAGDVYVAKTYRLKQHRHHQLRDEAYHRNLQMQDIIDTALGEYFEKRYGTQE